jgi:hypothetical protein
MANQASTRPASDLADPPRSVRRRFRTTPTPARTVFMSYMTSMMAMTLSSSTADRFPRTARIRASA